MRPVAIRIGALARKTGVSVRTLHHYDAIGLLKPSGRTEADHRLYDAGDVARLQQILSLRQIGLSLQEIQTFLDDPDCSPQRVVALHMDVLREQIDLQQRLYRRLEALAERLQQAEEVSVEEFIQTIEAIIMYDKYYTPEQMKTLEARAQQLGDEGMLKAQQEWEELYARVRAEMEKGTDPLSEPVIRLARRAVEMINAFTGGDPGIAQSLNTLYEQEGTEAASHGMIDREVWDYFGPAMDAARRS